MEEILASIRRIIADDGAPPRLVAPADREAEIAEELSGSLSPAQDASDTTTLAHLHAPGGDEAMRHVADAEAPADDEVAASLARVPEDVPMAETPGELPPHPLAPQPEVAGLGSVEERFAPHEAPPRQPGPHAARGEPRSPEPLLSAAANSSVAAAFNTLAASRLVDNSERLTGLVEEMLRPLVKDWVDKHLPGLVERLVVAEIERIGRS